MDTENPHGDNRSLLQDENGIDIGAIRRNLLLTPGQRLLRLQQAVQSLREIKDATARDCIFKGLIFTRFFDS
jgi:hypothetical protein